MMIRNMRWGYDTNLPHEEFLVETEAEDEKTQKHWFVLCAFSYPFYSISIDDVPILDRVIQDNFYEFCDWEMDQKDLFGNPYREDGSLKKCSERFEYNLAMEESPLVNVCKLSLIAMGECFSCGHPNDDSARRFVAPYLNRNVDEMELDY